MSSTSTHTMQDPAFGAYSITPSDANDLIYPIDALYVGGAGNAVVIFANGMQVTLNGLLAGAIYPFQIKRVLNTNTTATGLVGLLHSIRNP